MPKTTRHIIYRHPDGKEDARVGQKGLHLPSYLTRVAIKNSVSKLCMSMLTALTSRVADLLPPMLHQMGLTKS